MPRIMHVTFTKEFDVTIVADSLSELRAALQKQKKEFDDWCEDADWQYVISDTLSVQNPDLIPREFSEPDMGVVGKQCVAIEDYKTANPEFLSAVNSEALEVARKLSVEKLNLKLPFPGLADTG